MSDTLLFTVQDDGKILVDNPPEKIFEHDVFIPPIPEGAAEKGEPFQLDCRLSFKPSPEFAEWAEDNQVEFELGFHDDDNTPQLMLPNSSAAVAFRFVWCS